MKAAADIYCPLVRLASVWTRRSPMASSDQKVDRLRRIPLFEHTNSRQLGEVAQIADEVDVGADTVLARQGERGMDFFVIEKGSATVTRDGVKVADLEPGEFFGEMSLLEGTPRTATVTASSHCSLLVVRKPAFDALQDSVPGLREALVKALAARGGTRPDHTN
ncbi:MAG: cyclic nucleotide-binding domain-containing protein [Dehalococcoidia bacterium]|nr:cyclic nucleotide-binding domain-containing protein [Dehalococcoidia bacterium]